LWTWVRRAWSRRPLAAGEWGERQAEALLKAKGFSILGRRVRIGRRDELDLVARDDDVLVFVEVKQRQYEDYGRPSDAVDREKRRLMSRAAVGYLRKLRFRPTYLRFDIVEVIGGEGAGVPEVRHIANAFTLDRRYRLPF